MSSCKSGLANSSENQPGDSPDYFDLCRWKTQNVLVDHNVFSLDPAKVPLCARLTGCGYNGLFSNFGTYPDWSP